MHHGICAACGLSKAVERKRTTGELICGACSERRRLEALGKKECSLCQEIKAVYTHREGEPVCRRCYRNRINAEPCSRCGERREVIRRLENGSALCGTCAQKTIRERCAGCGETTITPYRDGNFRICGRCYRSLRKIRLNLRLLNALQSVIHYKETEQSVLPLSRENLIGVLHSVIRGKYKKCTHRWVIESPNGPTSLGECSLCGTIKEFSNSIDYSAFRSTQQQPLVAELP